MSSPDSFIASVAPAQPTFPPSSRYFALETATLEASDGTINVYLRRRFCPPPERLALLQEHIVALGDRLDNVTAQHLGDPEQFWRVADANRAMRPDELVEEVGRRLRITLPDGVQGVPGG
jgi:hypothetical protein